MKRMGCCSLQLRELLCPGMTKAAAPLMRMQILKVEAGKFWLGIEPSANKRKGLGNREVMFIN